MKIIIIEDELTTGEELKRMLEEADAEITVTTILSSVASAISWFEENPQPDLIFSDVRLGDGLSFSIFREVQVSAPVIFCTAYDEYAMKAFESNGIDYILKPTDEKMIEKSLAKYRRVKEHLTGETIVSRLDKAMTLLEPASYKRSILVHFRDRIIPVKTEEIEYVYAAKGNAIIHQSDNQDHIANYTIDEIERSLDPTVFFRANRQFIINRGIIQNIEHYFSRRLVVSTRGTTPEKIIISRERSPEFLRWLEH